MLIIGVDNDKLLLSEIHALWMPDDAPSC